MATKSTGSRGQFHKRKTLEPVYVSMRVVGYRFSPNGRMMYMARESVKPEYMKLDDSQLSRKLGFPANTISEWRRKYDDPQRGNYDEHFKDTSVNYFSDWWDGARETFSAPAKEYLMAIGLDKACNEYNYWAKMMDAYGLTKQDTSTNVFVIPANLDTIRSADAGDYDTLRRELLERQRGLEHEGGSALVSRTGAQQASEDSGAKEVQGRPVALPDALVHDGGRPRSGESGEAVSGEAAPESNNRVLERVPATSDSKE